MILKKYIIAAHDNPNFLCRLIKKLKDWHSFFYIHIDLKSDINSFKKVLSFDNIIFIKERVNCIWGDFSQVEATINLLKSAVKEPGHSKIIFISGQDYPIKSNYHINRYLNDNIGYEFIDYDMSPIPDNHPDYVNRIKKIRINLSSKRGDIVLLYPMFSGGFKNAVRILKVFLKGKLSNDDWRQILKFERKLLFEENYKGSNWFCLNSETVIKILNYINTNKRQLHDYYRYTHCADELMFHTILKEIMKSDDSIKIKPNLHFVDWNRKNVPLPVTFRKEDLELLMTQPENKLFARKFDINVDEEILDLIDKNVV